MDQADVHSHLGDLYGARGATDQAAQEYATAKQRDPTYPDPYMRLAKAYTDQKRADLAEQEYQALLTANPGYLPAYVALGDLYTAQGQADQAAAVYTQAIGVPARSAADHYQRALAFRALGRWPEARSEAETAVAGLPNDAPAQRVLAQIAQQVGDNATALAHYARATALDPLDYTSPYQAGRILALQGDRDGARQQWQIVIQRKPDHPSVYFDLAALEEQSGRPDAAIAAYTRAIAEGVRLAEAYTHRGQYYASTYQWSKAAADFSAAIGSDPARLDARDGLVLALIALYRPDDAIKAAQDGLKLQPNDPRPSVELGEAELAKGDYTAAATPLQAAQTLAPNDPAVLRALGHAAILRDEDEAAQQYLSAALGAQPNDPIAAALLGDDHYNHQRYAAATDWYSKALTMAPPDYPPAHSGLGRVDEVLNRPLDAKAQYQAALKADPRYAEAHLFLGDVFTHEGQWQQAVDQFTLATQDHPQWATAYTRLGAAVLSAGRPADAVPSLQRATQLDPNDLDAWLELGQANRDSGQRGAAITAYQQAVKLKPDRADAWYWLGLTYLDDGQRDQAVAALQQAVATAGADTTTRDAAQRALAGLAP